MDDLVLKAQDLKKSIKGCEIIRGVCMQVHKGQIVGLFGANGAGKSTTFYMISGLVRASSGQICLNEQDITHLRLHERARLGIAYLPQESSILRDLSVRENLQIAAQIQGLSADCELIDECLEQLDITNRADRLAKSLSGGERRRLEIARALMLSPKFLLLDEPFAGVDPKSILDVQKIILQLKARNIGVLITDHNARETLKICDYAYVMDHGSILASGSSEEIAANKIVAQRYLGEGFVL